MLFRLAEIALDHADGVVNEIVFPIVSEDTLRDLVKEGNPPVPSQSRWVDQALAVCPQPESTNLLALKRVAVSQ